MNFDKINVCDTDAVMRILEGGKARLHEAGIDQWQRGYPNRTSVESDIAAGVGMALREGDKIVAYGAVIFTGEAAYSSLTGGKWLTEGDYVVVHRLCVADDCLGRGYSAEFMRRVEELAYGRVASVRIDTHPENKIMQNLVRRLGFTYCGDVIIESRRLAFEKILGAAE